MDACNPGINAKNLARLVKQETGMELNLNRNQVCDIHKSIQEGKLPLPPMVLSKDGKYMLDRKSPLSERDFEILFGSTSKIDELKRVARKVGLSNYKDMTKMQLVEAIESVLSTKNIREPIRLHISSATGVKERRVRVNSNNNYPNNLNVNNANGNGVRNLENISKESNNLNINNGNRVNGNRVNGNRVNGNRVNGNRVNGNRNNGNRNLARISNESSNLNRRPPMNSTTARYVNAAIRAPNPERIENISKIIAASRNGGGGGNLSRIIEAVRQKPSTNGEMKMILNKMMRSQKTGDSEEVRRLAKELNAIKRMRVEERPAVNDKNKKVAELEKYIVNKAKNLGDKQVEFMNKGQQFVKGYKAGNNMYNTAKTRIKSMYDQIYKEKMNATKFENAVAKLQSEKVDKIVNATIRNKAMQLMEEYKKTGSTSARNNVIKLQGLDEGLRDKQTAGVERQFLNSVRNEALQNISTYNIRTGLAKINAYIKEKEKRVDDELSKIEYNKVNNATKKNFRRRYLNGLMSFNELVNKMRKAPPRIVPLPVINSTNVNKARNTVIRELETKRTKPGVNSNKINGFIQQLKNANSKNKINELINKTINPYLYGQDVNARVKDLETQLAASAQLSNTEKKKLQNQLNKALKDKEKISNELTSESIQVIAAKQQIENLEKKLQNATLSEAEKNAIQKTLSEKNAELNAMRKKANAANALIKSQNAAKITLEKEIQVLRNKLKNDASMSVAERNAIQRQLNNAMKNKSNLNNRLRKAEQNRNSYMREMNSLASNVRNITKQKENANAEIQTLRKKLENNASLSAAERNAIQQQLNNARKNKNNLNNRLRKAEQEKMNYMRQMNALASNYKKNIENAKAEANAEIQQLKNRLANSNLTTQERNELKQSLNKAEENKRGFMRELEMAKQRLAEERAAKNAKIQLTEAESTERRLEIERLKKQLENNASMSASERNAIQKQLNNAMKNKEKIEQEKMNYMRQMNSLATNVRNITKQKENANAEIETLRKKLENNASMSAAERNAIQQQLNNAKKNKNNLNNRLRKAEQEKMNYMREMNALVGNVRNITKQKENANAEIETLRKKLQNNASMSAAERNAIRQQLNAAMRNKNNLNRRLMEANAARAEANQLRVAAQQEAMSSKAAANAANAEAKRIAAELESGRIKSQEEINALKKQMENALERRRVEMQNQINAVKSEFNTYKTQSNKIVRNGAAREAAQKNRIAALEINRNRWQAELESKKQNLEKLTQNLASKNKNLEQKASELTQLQSMLSQVQKELNNTKASSTEKNRIRQELEAKQQNLTAQLNRALKEVSVARGAVEGLRQQRNNLAKASTINQQMAQQTTRLLEKSRLNANRASNMYNTQNFNATAAFQQMGNNLAANRNASKMAARSRWRNVAMPGALNLKEEENLRIAKNTLRNHINSLRPNGEYTIGGRAGFIRRKLKSELALVSNLEQLRNFRKRVAAEKNKKNAEIAQRRMNQVLAKRGTGTNFSFGNQSQPAATLNERLNVPKPSYANALRGVTAENKLRALTQL